MDRIFVQTGFRVHIVDGIEEQVKTMNGLCKDVYYPDSSVNSKCQDYKLVYEQVVNSGSLGQMIGGIAHNLKTPIMSIAGAAEGLSDLIKEVANLDGDFRVRVGMMHPKNILNDVDEIIKNFSNDIDYLVIDKEETSHG